MGGTGRCDVRKRMRAILGMPALRFAGVDCVLDRGNHIVDLSVSEFRVTREVDERLEPQFLKDRTLAILMAADSPLWQEMKREVSKFDLNSRSNEVRDNRITVYACGVNEEGIKMVRMSVTSRFSLKAYTRNPMEATIKPFSNHPPPIYKLG